MTLFAGAWAVPLHAQGSVTAEGALFLLRPIGAQSVGVGQAVAARRDGSESLWWNPAALAAMSSREFAIHHSQDFFATGDAVSIIVPSSLLGVVGLAVDIQDFGEQENTAGPGEPPSGTILTRAFIFSAAYATPVGTHFRSGVVFKVVQSRIDCTGPCDLPTSVAQTYALDAGVQYDLGGIHGLSLGATVRNLGFPLQVEDSPQADPLPGRLRVGLAYRPPLPTRYANDADVLLSLDVVDKVHLERPLPHFGAEFAWQKRAFVRAGYVFRRDGTESGGPALGLGLVARNIKVDLSRIFTGFSADAGQAPTFLSLRVEF